MLVRSMWASSFRASWRLSGSRTVMTRMRSSWVGAGRAPPQAGEQLLDLGIGGGFLEGGAGDRGSGNASRSSPLMPKTFR